MAFRQYALSSYDGERVSIKTKADRQKIIGKKIGYDTIYSTFAGFGVVTDERRGELEISGHWYSISSLEQVCVLREQ